MKSKRRVYNDGTQNKMFVEGAQPEGWVLGYCPETLRLKKEKTKQTCLQKYGVENPSLSREVSIKKRETFLKHFGDGYFKEDLNQRRKEGNLAKYGVEYSWQADEVKEKIKQTNLERYGVEYAAQSKVVQDKAKQTNLERYGVEHPLQSSEIQDKVRQTNLEKYNTECTFQSNIIKDKSRKTNLERYGVENPSQSEKIKQKKKETLLKHYGVESPMQSEIIKEKAKITNLAKYGVVNTLQCENARLGFNNDSKPNKAFEKLLVSKGILYQREFPLEAYSYDFRIGNTLIEIDPYATHNIEWTPFDKGRGVSEDYHFKKTLTAEKHGYHCIHIFDWDRYDEIINKFLIKRKFTGNPSEYFKEIGYKIFLFLEDRVTNQNHVKDIIEQFIQEKKPLYIKVDNDRSKFSSKVYEVLGFRLIRISEPRCIIYNTSENRIVENSSDKTVSICDCGTFHYAWSFKR